MIAILVLRLALHRYSRSKFDSADWLALVSILVLVFRTPSVHIVTLYGTSDISVAQQQDFNFTSEEISQRRIGSILTLLNRILYTTFLWLQTGILLLFYDRVLGSVSWVKKALGTTWFILGASYVAVVVATFTECHPIYLYWTVVPHPDSCVKANIQLFLQGILNVILELMALLIAIPVIKSMQRPLMQKLRIALLLGLGLFSITVTGVRLPMIFDQNSSQRVRTFWACIQILASGAVVNIPRIYGRIRIGWRRRRNSGQVSSSSRTVSRTESIKPEASHSEYIASV